jgi:hypothetical protein
MKFTFPLSMSILLSLFIGMLNQSDETLFIPDETQLSTSRAVNSPKEITPASVHRPAPFINQPNEPAAPLTQGMAALLAPAVTAIKTAVLVGTDNGTTGPTPGDVIEYTVTIANTGPDDATGVNFTDTVDPNTTLVPGSVKSAPIAVKDAYSTVGNVSISVPAASGLTSNDVNLDGDVLTITAVDQTGTEGQVTFNATDGSFTFNPNPGFTGATTFTYTISDGTFTSTGTVTITMTGMIWFIDDNATAPGDGRLGSAFSSIANFNSIAADDPNDNIFLYSGSYNGQGFTLLNGQNLIGQGTDEGTLATLAGVTFAVHPPISGSVPSTGGGTPTIALNVTAITAAQNNDIYGITINNSGSTGLSGVGLGTLKVRDVTISNTGGIAVNLSTGTLDAIFQSISASGASYGIRLQSTTGSFEVTGTGTTDGSGGTISNITNRGIEVLTATNITLKNMTLNSANTGDAGFDGTCDEDQNTACYAAIHLSSVNGVTMNNVDVTSTAEQGINGNSVTNLVMTNCTVTGAGTLSVDPTSNQDESAVKIIGLFGTCSITGCTFSNSGCRNTHIRTGSGTLNLTVNNSSFSNTSYLITRFDCFEMRTTNTATATVNITNSTFQRAGSKGIQALAEGSSTFNFNITGSSIQRFGNPMAGIEVGSNGNGATMNYNINNNSNIESSGEVAVLASTFLTSDINGRTNSNASITNLNTTATTFSTIAVLHENNGQAIVEIKDNPIVTSSNTDIPVNLVSLNGTIAASRLDVTLDNNNITNSTNTVAGLEGVLVRAGDTAPPGGTDVNTVCAHIVRNDLTLPTGYPRAFRLWHLDAPTIMTLQGPGPDISANWGGAPMVGNGNTNTNGTTTAYGPNTGLTFGATCLVPTHSNARIAVEQLAIEEKNRQQDEVTQIREEIKNETDTLAVTKGPVAETNEVEEAARRAVVLAGETVTVGGMGGFLLPAGQNIIIKFQVTINNPLPSLPLGPCQISNQGTVTGSNFSTLLTDDTALPGAADPTTTTLSTHTLGNLVFKDNNKNGVFDGGDAGIDGVTVNLYNDVNDNNVLDAGDGAAIATTTTASGGLYSFPNLCSGKYIVQIPSTEFGSGQELNGLISSPGGAAPDPDNNTNNDDNGQDAINSSIASQAITLEFSGAAVEVNNSLDFSFRTPTTVTINDVTLNEGSGGGTTSYTFTVNRSDVSEAFNLTVNTNTIAATATSGSDFTAISGGTVSFTAGGNMSETVTITVNADNIVEANETFNVVLSGAPDGVILTDATGVGTITNDDAATVTLTGGVAQNEGNAGTTSYTFTATLNNAVQGGFSVAYSTTDGTATTADNDYQDNDGPTLAFTGTAGETKTITVLVNGDNKVEANETFSVALGSISSAPAGVTVAGMAQTGTITNDDAATVMLTGGVAQNEGNAGTTSYTFTATLTNAVQGGFSVAYSTTDGTATTADNDYQDNDGPALAFTGTAGETKTITVLVNGDNKVEANETFSVALGSISSAPAGVTVAGMAQTGTINNDDNTTITLTGGTAQNEGNTGTTSYTFTATLTNPVQGGFGLIYTTDDGTATTADNDYTNNDGTLNFAGTAAESKTITVSVNGDLTIETDETFTVQLRGILMTPLSSGLFTLQISPQTGTITNDELDWGDAPTSAQSGFAGTYPTLSANNGARHAAALGGLRLGATIDGDLDGQPTATASGDGTDEDGVTLPSALIVNNSAAITVNASAISKLDAWVDFNRDGDWNDAGEQIFTNTNLTAGNNNLTFNVPAAASLGTSFARFRVSTAGGLSVTGLASDGEVEDYQVSILDNQYSISSPTVTEGNASTTNLTFAISRTTTSGSGSVNYAISGGSASSGTDYNTLAAGTINFTNGGNLSENVTVVVNGDNIVEDNETVLITLSNPVNGGIGGTGIGTGTITNDDQATLTLSGGTAQNEGNIGSGPVPYTFTATLSAPVQGGFQVSYTTGNGIATAGTDYTDNDGLLTFVGTTGETKSWTVNVSGDNTVELNETFEGALSSITMTSAVQVAAISLSASPQTATITNDDAANVSIAANVSQAENLSPQIFTITLSNPVDVPVTVQFTTADNTATDADNDYEPVAPANQTVSFLANTTMAQTINVTVNNDNKVEADEVFNVSIGTLAASSRNVTFGTSSRTGTIINDDAATVTLSAAASPLQFPEGNSGTTNFVFTATLNNPVQGGFQIAYTTSDGLALTPEDYTDNDGTLTFTGNANETQNITVQAKGDLKVEANESFFMALGAITNAPTGVTANTTQLQGLIVNDELDWGDAPDSYNTLSANNGARHNTSIAFHLGATIDGDLDGQPTATANGDDTDAEGDDDDGVTLPSVLVTSTTANITVNASGAGFLNAWVDFNNSGNWDASEQIFTNVALTTGDNALSFAVPAGATPANTFARFRYTTASVASPAFTGLQTTGEVEDYAIQIVNTQFLIDDVAVTEGNAGTTNLTFTISRTVNANACSVNYAITGGTATSPSDYQIFTNGTVNFTAGGAFSQTVTVVINGDNTVELNETILMTLSNPINGSILDGSGTGTITNDDAATITISNPSVVEGTFGTTTMTFDLALSQPSDANVVVNYGTVDGTATTADNDYQTTSGTHTFTPGQNTKQISVTVNGDCKVETNETLLLRLSSLQNNGRNVTLSGGGATLDGTGTIQNSPLPTATIGGTTAVCQNAPQPNITFTGSSGTAPYTFTYKINGGSELTVTTSAMSNTVTVAHNTSMVGGFNYTLVSVSDMYCSQNQSGSAAITVVIQPVSPTLNAKTPNLSAVCAGTGVSATFNAGSGGVSCSDDYTVSIDGGTPVAYTPGSTIGANATSSIVIQGRRANCSAGSGCNGTSYVTLASWNVSPQPVGPTLNAKTPNIPTICAGTAVIATFNLGSGGVGCADDYVVIIDNGSPIPYSQGTLVGSNATTSIVIQGRRANCSAGSGCTGTDYVTLASWNVVPQPVGPTLNTKTPNLSAVCVGTGVSATFNAGSGGVGCSDDYVLIVDAGTPVAYTPGSTVGTTATTSIEIRGRRANCSAQTGCNGTAYVTLASWSVNPQPVGPTLLAKTPNVSAICFGTGVSATFNAGSGGVGCLDNFTLSIDGGTPLAYTPGSTVGANANSSIVIQGRRAGCSAGAGCNGTTYVTLASWSVSPQPVGPSLLAKTPNVSAICFGTGVSATFNAGSGGVGCSDDYTVSIDGGTAVAYTPGSTVGTTAVSSIVIQGRRANCDAASGCNGTPYVTLASWSVNPLPTASISGSTALCQNAPFPNVTFTGNGGTKPYVFTYQINTGGNLTVSTTGVSNSVSVAQTTAVAGVFNYSLVSVKDANGCEQLQGQTATITVHAPPVVSTPQGSLCTGLTMTLSPTSGGSWQSSNPSIATVNNVGLVQALTAGVVYFTFTQSSTGCSASTANVTIKPTPSSNLTASKVDVCANTEVTLNPNCSIPTSTLQWNPGGPTVTPAAATLPYVYRARCVADGCVGNETSVEVRTHRILVDMKDLDVGALPLPIVRSVKDNMAPTNLIQAPVFPRRWTFIANGCDASESAEFKLSGPVNFSAIDNAGVYALFANDGLNGNLFYSIDHPNYGNGGSFPNGTYTLTVELRSQDGVGGPFPKNRVPVGPILATRTLQFTVVGPSHGGQQSAVGGRQSVGSEQWRVSSGQFAEVVPNPVSNIMRLKVSDAKGQNVNVNLIDASGRTMLQRTFVPDTNQHQEEFNVGDITNGMYFLRVNTENKNTTLKVVKVE